MINEISKGYLELFLKTGKVNDFMMYVNTKALNENIILAQENEELQETEFSI